MVQARNPSPGMLDLLPDTVLIRYTTAQASEDLTSSLNTAVKLGATAPCVSTVHGHTSSGLSLSSTQLQLSTA